MSPGFGSFSQTLIAPVIEQLQAKIAELEAQLQELKLRSTIVAPTTE
ncbi:MAG: hypothetical protein JNL67_21215 [Planctomycetaceae bacterium]|nr:hypothetical protein [Planctomycetaceae bacterium]